VKIARSTLAVAAIGALALTACSDSGDNASTSGGGTIAGADCATGTIKASGSSAQKNAMTEWINAYQTACSGATIEYSPSGSSAGRADFVNNQVAFAGSDSAMSDELSQAAARCNGTPPINIPMVGGAIALTYNLEGVDNLVLTPDATAKIFNSEITKWNDPAIAKVNPDVTLPDQPIAQFHRSDGSGTTDNFTQWLKAAAPDAWPYESGSDWAAKGGQGAKGSDGVASSVKSTPNSIGYVEESFLEQANAKAAWIDNGGGAVELTTANATNGLGTAQVTGQGNNLTLKLDYTTKSPNAYPVVLVTYEITCSKGLPADQSALTKGFLEYTASAPAQQMLPDLGYVPLPSDLIGKVQTAVGSLA